MAETSTRWAPDITVTNMHLSLTDWNRGAALTKDCKPAQLPGKLFLSGRARLFVLRDIQFTRSLNVLQIESATENDS